MKVLLPKELRTVFKDVRHGESDTVFKILNSTIENIWGYDVIMVKNYSQINYRTLYSKSNWLKLDRRELFGDPEGFYWHEETEYFEGVLTYDKKIERFALFQFREKFDYDNCVEVKDRCLLNGINKDYLENKNIDKSFLSSIESTELNLELSKLIIIVKEVPTTELLKYLHRQHETFDTDRGIELWKLSFIGDEFTWLEKVQNDFNQDSDNTLIKEIEFFRSYKVSNILINKYELLKEYLRFNFNCRINICSVIERDKLYNFYEEAIQEEWVDDYESGPIDLSSKNLLQSYFNDLVIEYDKKGLTHLGDLKKINCLDFCSLRLIVFTQGLDFDLLFSVAFKEDFIDVTMSYIEDGETWQTINSFKINCETNYTELNDNIIGATFLCDKVYKPPF